MGEEDYDKYTRKPTCEKDFELLDENMCPVAFEVCLRKKIVKDNLPVQVGVQILMHSKLMFLEFMEFLRTHLKPGSFKPMYADTDRYLTMFKTLKY